MMISLIKGVNKSDVLTALCERPSNLNCLCQTQQQQLQSGVTGNESFPSRWRNFGTVFMRNCFNSATLEDISSFNGPFKVMPQYLNQTLTATPKPLFVFVIVFVNHLGHRLMTRHSSSGCSARKQILSFHQLRQV